MEDFRSQLAAVIDAILAEGGEPVFLVVHMEGAAMLRKTRGNEHFDRFQEACIETVAGAARGCDAFTYGDERVIGILDGARYDRLRTFALIQKLRRTIPLVGQSFDCELRPEFDVLDYDANGGAGAIIAQIARMDSDRERDRHAA